MRQTFHVTVNWSCEQMREQLELVCEKHPAAGRGVRTASTLVFVAFLVAGCANGFPGDPAPPIAFGVNATHALSELKVLVCPGERVTRITLTRDVSPNAVFKPGPVLWQIEATGKSTVATFAPNKPLAGFHTVAADSLPITGRIVVDVRTTSGTFDSGTDTTNVPADSILLSGQVLDSKLEQLVIKNRCR